MARVLALSSQVARGAIGLSGIVPALQALGHEVIALPTILLSNHPGHPRFAGERVAPALLGSMLETLDANGWLAAIDAVMTGYLPSPDHVAVAREAVDRVRRHRPEALYLLDPVLGDEPKGLYIAEPAAAAIRTQLLPAATAVKLNRFELQWLTGTQIKTAREAAVAAEGLGPGVVVVTSASGPAAPAIENVVVEGATHRGCRVLRRYGVPNGTGDVLGALVTGYHVGGAAWSEALARASAAMDLILEASAGRDELWLPPVLCQLARIEGLPLGAID